MRLGNKIHLCVERIPYRSSRIDKRQDEGRGGLGHKRTLGRKWRSALSGAEYRVALVCQIVIFPKGSPDGRFPSPRHVPGKTDARAEVLVGGISENNARRWTYICGQVYNCRVAAFSIEWNRRDLVSQPKIQGKSRRESPVILRIHTHRVEAGFAI